MARIMALDYGIKRTGVAVTDELQIIASGLTTVETHELITFLEKYLSLEDVEAIVIGEPKQMNYSHSENEVFIAKFIQELNQKFPQLLIERVDERFTSKMAFQSMIDSGMKKKNLQNKAMIDKISATLILQTYLERKS